MERKNFDLKGSPESLILPQLFDDSRKIPLCEVSPLVLPLVEHFCGPHFGVGVHGYPTVEVIPAHDGSALIVDGAVAVNLGDGTRHHRDDAREA